MHLNLGVSGAREFCLQPDFLAGAVVVELLVGVMVAPLGNVIMGWDLLVVRRSLGQSSLDCG